MPKHAFNRPSTYTTNHESSKCDSKFMHANCDKAEICYGCIWSEESVPIEQASNPSRRIEEPIYFNLEEINSMKKMTDSNLSGNDVCGEETSDENLNLRKTEYLTHCKDSTRKIPNEFSTSSPLEAAINRSPRSFNVKSLISKIDNPVLVQAEKSSRFSRQLANIYRASFVPQSTFVDACGEETSDENRNLRRTENVTHYEDSTRKIPKELSASSPLEAAINRSPRSFSVKSRVSKINNAVLVQTGVSAKFSRQLANSSNIHRTSFVPQNTFVDHSNSSQAKRDESLLSNPFDLTTQNSSRKDVTLENGFEVINLDQIKTAPRGKESDAFLELSDNLRKDIFNQEINFPEMQDKRKGFCLLSDTLKMDRHYLPCAVKANPKLHPDTNKSERVVSPYAAETGRDFNMRQSNAQIDLIAGHVDPFIIEHCDVQPPRISKDFRIDSSRPIQSARGDGGHTQKYCVWENLNQNELSFKERAGKHLILPRNMECKSDYQKSSHLIDEGVSIDYIDSSTQTPNCEEMPDSGENTLTTVANSEDTFTCMRCLMCFWPLAVGAIVGAGIHSLFTGDRSENLCIC
ncbi:hypothetical protein CDAR_122271 [Caerostris darwini]|uniref:Uncharacterized protein n=1 Tax=Caerostris darwini TaxID=1538125 RepID=A0AAV4W9V0_9ARAC|nr:hypothetical protein CDAR_122271 [Caerostris darwini]